MPQPPRADAPDLAPPPGLTVAAAARWAAGLLAERGVPESRLDAELLLARLLGWDRAALHAHPDRPLGESEAREYAHWVARRRAREPLPYITGVAAFYGLELAVTPDVLIPRPETELLVELALGHLRRAGLARPLVADVGTGSGAIAIALARALPGARVLAVDLSAAALRVAAANARRHGVGARIGFWQGDLLAACAGPLDLLLANLPYIRPDERPGLEPEVGVHEPWLALDGGPDGLAVYRAVLLDAVMVLKPGGGVFFEIGDEQGPALRDLLEEYGFVEVTVQRDYAGKDRYATGTLGF